MREVYSNPMISRYRMWRNLHGESVREDSAEADLFKTIIHDLSVGHVIRQHRPVDHMGRFIKTPRKKQREEQLKTHTNQLSMTKSHMNSPVSEDNLSTIQ